MSDEISYLRDIDKGIDEVVEQSKKIVQLMQTTHVKLCGDLDDIKKRLEHIEKKVAPMVVDVDYIGYDSTTTE